MIRFWGILLGFCLLLAGCDPGENKTSLSNEAGNVLSESQGVINSSRQIVVVNETRFGITNLLDLDVEAESQGSISVDYLDKPVLPAQRGNANFRTGETRCEYNLIVHFSNGQFLPLEGVDVCRGKVLSIELMDQGAGNPPVREQRRESLPIAPIQAIFKGDPSWVSFFLCLVFFFAIAEIFDFGQKLSQDNFNFLDFLAFGFLFGSLFSFIFFEFFGDFFYIL